MMGFLSLLSTLGRLFDNFLKHVREGRLIELGGFRAEKRANEEAGKIIDRAIDARRNVKRLRNDKNNRDNA